MHNKYRITKTILREPYLADTTLVLSFWI